MEYYFPTATVTLSKLTGAPSSPLAMLQIKKHLASPLSTPLVSRPSSSLSLSLPSLLGIRRQHSSEICRIGIIGGGICGVTAAHALVKRLPDHKAFEIVVLEGDPSGLEGDNDLERQKSGTDKLQSIPQWTAATARNGNSLVPAASMHVFSRSDAIFQIVSDTVKEWYFLQRERFFEWRNRHFQFRLLPKRINDFNVIPPYFALHLVRCLGPNASREESMTFVRFLSHFLYTSLWLGHEAAGERAHKVCNLAKANRHMYLAAIADMDEDTRNNTGHSKGFMSLHRSLQKAEAAVEEAREFGEEAFLVTPEEAIQVEPRLERLPFGPIYGVSRPNDYVANCETFIRRWIKESADWGVHFETSNVEKLERVESDNDKEKPTYHAFTADGMKHEFDILILASGVRTPLLASRLGVANYCPTYPLRGFSLTLFTKEPTKPTKQNLLKQPISIDSMYCTSVAPSMARLVGFGEFCGFPDKAHDLPSIGPKVLTRYAQEIFPDAENLSVENVQPCFRPVSPDDLPIVGEVPSMPGLFIHTGHGTLGWTMGLATGDCIAQAVIDRLNGQDTQKGTFTLAGGISINRTDLSPKRFSKTFGSLKK